MYGLSIFSLFQWIIYIWQGISCFYVQIVNIFFVSVDYIHMVGIPCFYVQIVNIVCFSGLYISGRESPVSKYRLSIFFFVSVDYIHMVGNPQFLSMYRLSIIFFVSVDYFIYILQGIPCFYVQIVNIFFCFSGLYTSGRESPASMYSEANKYPRKSGGQGSDTESGYRRK